MKAITKQQIIRRLVTSVAITTSINSLIGLGGYFAYRSGKLSPLLNFTKGFGLNPIATLAILASTIVAFTLLFVCLVIFRDRIFYKRATSEYGKLEADFEKDKRLAKQGDAMAQLRVGFWYFSGRAKHERKGVAYKDLAPKYHKSLAEEEKGGDCLKEAVIDYLTGTLIKVSNRDKKRAFKYYKLSADQGNPDAQLMVGKFYKRGYLKNKNSTIKNYRENHRKDAFKCYKLSADQGNDTAQAEVGYRYSLEGGRGGVEQNDKLAFKYYKLSADQGNATSQFAVGWRYLEGKGVKRDLDLSLKYLELSDEGGCLEAEFWLKELQEEKRKSEEVNLKNNPEIKKAFKVYKLSADNNKDAKYQLKVGDCYLKGLGVDKDEKLAFKYFKLSADQNNIEAYKRVSECYLKGIGVDKNPQLAEEYSKNTQKLVRSYV